MSEWKQGDIKDSSEPYEAGTVQIATPRCAPDTCREPVHDHSFYYAEEPTVYLPHSCNEWLIGGRKEVEAMIGDLQQALKQLDGPLLKPKERK